MEPMKKAQGLSTLLKERAVSVRLPIREPWSQRFFFGVVFILVPLYTGTNDE